MPKRFSATEKWQDEWFSSLKPLEKLLFLFIIDNCDNAGFFEINARLNAFIIGIDQTEYLEAMQGISKCYYLSEDKRKIWVRTFLVHQKNWPLNEVNNAHKQILGIIESNRANFKEHIKNFSPFLAPKQPLIRGIGKGIGKGIVYNKEDELIKEYEEVEKSKTSIIGFIKNNEPKFISPFIDLWNIFAAERNKSQLKSVTDMRTKKFNVRVNETQFDFIKILSKAKDSEFLMTKSFFTFDWIIENQDNYLQVLEGKYDNDKKDKTEVQRSKEQELMKSIGL